MEVTPETIREKPYQGGYVNKATDKLDKIINDTIDPDKTYSIKKYGAAKPELVALGSELIEHYSTDKWANVFTSEHFPNYNGLMFSVIEFSSDNTTEEVLCWQQPIMTKFRKNSNNGLSDNTYPANNDTYGYNEGINANAQTAIAEIMAKQNETVLTNTLSTLQDTLIRRDESYSALEQENENLRAELLNRERQHNVEIQALQTTITKQDATIDKLKYEAKQENWKRSVEEDYKRRLDRIEAKNEAENSSVGLSDLMGLASMFMQGGFKPPTAPGQMMANMAKPMADSMRQAPPPPKQYQEEPVDISYDDDEVEEID